MSCFCAGASFSTGENLVEVYSIPFMNNLQGELSKLLEHQYEEFIKFRQIEFDGRYKVDSNECFSISEYVDPDNTIDGFLSVTQGTSSDTLTSVDNLDDCKALIFNIPQFPDLFLIQRFSKSYLARRDRWYGIGNSNSFKKIEHSAFTIASSLTGIYDIKNKKLLFKSVQSIRSALPGFTDHYVPGADKAMMEKFFSAPFFDAESARKIIEGDSATISRLVWLLVEQNENIKARMNQFEKYNEKLNLQSLRDGKIVLSKEVKRTSVILRILLGDVFEDKGQIYLTNSKKPLAIFENKQE